jgi:hypothetical protein
MSAIVVGLINWNLRRNRSWSTSSRSVRARLASSRRVIALTLRRPRHRGLGRRREEFVKV